MAIILELREGGAFARLRADRLPWTVWGSNLRAFLPRARWQSLSRRTTELAERECEVCGMPAADGRALDCNELWAFDRDSSTQRFLGVIALCEWCHLTQHSGRAANQGRAQDVIDVLSHMNHWSRRRAWRDFDESAERFREMSRVEWNLDLSLLRGWISIADFPTLEVPASERHRLGNTFDKTRPQVDIEVIGDPPAVIWDWAYRVDTIDAF